MITAERRLLAALNVPYQPLIHSPTPRPSNRKPMHREVLEPAPLCPPPRAAPWSPSLTTAAASTLGTPLCPPLRSRVWNVRIVQKTIARHDTRQRGAARAIAACCVEHCPLPSAAERRENERGAEKSDAEHSQLWSTQGRKAEQNGRVQQVLVS